MTPHEIAAAQQELKRHTWDTFVDDPPSIACVTPAMEAGVTDHIWTIEKVPSLLDRPIREKEAA